MRALIFLLLIPLSGCAQRFDCPYKEGVRCLSLSEVDKRVSSGNLNAKQTQPIEPLLPEKLADLGLRTQEEVLTVWIAPYQTEDGTYHEEKRMHFVAKPSGWLATKEIQAENL